ncbi:MAG: hypothetical protein GX963_03040 [Bacteroidales bacterium]|nr:hypothetical protein [Bacteroidales bacterium]
MNENTLNKIKIVADIVKQHYEPGRQDRCLKWCYSNIVKKLYPMSERTFWRYMAIAVNRFGYEFKEKGETFYLDKIFYKMQPQTIEKIKDVAESILDIKPKGKTKNKVYNELQERTGMQINKSSFSKYILVAETYLGYNFNFQ